MDRATVTRTPETIEDVMRRWPRLTAHLICHSLGYFTPGAAANAIRHYKQGEAFFCEWYIHMAGYSNQELLETGRKAIERALRNRHHHRGYMAHYPLARQLVQEELAGRGPELASWF